MQKIHGNMSIFLLSGIPRGGVVLTVGGSQCIWVRDFDSISFPVFWIPAFESVLVIWNFCVSIVIQRLAVIPAEESVRVIQVEFFSRHPRERGDPGD